MTGPAGVPAAVAFHVTRGAVTAFAAVVGLLIGSFLNVVIYRVPRRLSVAKPGSFCPHCETPVRPVDNVPVVSWLVLRGRCHQCGGAISGRYPLVEGGTAVVFAAIGWGLGAHWAVVGFCVLAATLVVLVAVERDGLDPPISAALVGTAVAVVALVGAGAADHRWNHVVGVLIGVAVAAAVVAVSVRRAAAASVLLPVGAVLGWLGPTSAAEGLATAAVVLVIARRIVARGASRANSAGVEGPRRALALALAAGAVVSTVIAVAVGAGAGR